MRWTEKSPSVACDLCLIAGRERIANIRVHYTEWAELIDAGHPAAPQIDYVDMCIQHFRTSIEFLA